MTHQKTLIKKLLSATLVSVFAVAPLALGFSAAQADPPRHAPAWGWRDKNRHHDRDRDRDHNDYRTFTGTVSRVNSDSKFELRYNGDTYDVYVSGRMPRSLDRNDVVRVYGYRSGNNDIRNASVTVLRNR
jgi:Ni/Co efflux regulator RcnB